MSVRDYALPDVTPEAPAAVDVERTLLGSILVDNAAWDRVAHRLREEALFLDSHRRIWRAMHRMFALGKTVDIATLSEQLGRTVEIEAVGGIGYLFSLTENLPRKLPVGEYAEILREKAALRKILDNAMQMTSAAASAGSSAQALIARQATFLDELQAELTPDDNPLVSAYSIQVLDAFMRHRNSGEGMTGLPYGLAELDLKTDGMYPGEVTVIGARNGVGKSILMLQAARANCLAGTPVHLISLEMTRAQCLHRLWATESGVYPEKIRKPRLANLRDAADISEAATRIAQWPLRIHDRAEATIDQITAMLRLSIRKHGTRVFCVDYAQCVATHEKEIRLAVMKASRELTKIAKGEGVHLILLSQLKRTETGSDRPPHLGDLRETGQLGDDAHCVLLLHRPWDDEKGQCVPEGEMICPKQREGVTFVSRIRFNSRNLQFEGML